MQLRRYEKKWKQTSTQASVRESWCRGLCVRYSQKKRKHYRKKKGWKKPGWDSRFESNNNGGICGHRLALNKALCFFSVNNFLWWRKADGSTYLCIYLDLVDSVSQRSLCYGLAAASRSQAKQIILHLIKTDEGQKHSYKQKKLKIAQGSLIASLQQTIWTRK